MKSHRVSRPAQEILSYFLRNPAAVDSMEGIARWRLLEQAIHRTVLETEAALKWLVEQGYLMQIEHRRSRPLFRLNPQKQKAAESLLQARGRE